MQAVHRPVNMDLGKVGMFRRIKNAADEAICSPVYTMTLRVALRSDTHTVIV